MQDLKTGIPQEGVKIKIWQGEEREEGFTNNQGLYSWKRKWKEGEEAVIMVEKDNEFAFLNFYPYYWEGGKLKAFIYCERPLYKPGQTVLGKAILREVSTDKYRSSREKSGSGSVDYRDNEYGKKAFHSRGSVNFSFPCLRKLKRIFNPLCWRDREFYQVISLRIMKSQFLLSS